MGQRGCSALALRSKEEKRGFATRPGARRGSAPPRGGDGEISIAQRRRSGVGCGDPAALIPPPLSDATTLPPLAPPAKLGVLVLSAPLSPRLDASQWISMSHSNAERTGDLKIKKERVFFCPSVRFPTAVFSPTLSPRVQLWGMEALGDVGSLLPAQGTKDGDKRPLWGWHSVPMAPCYAAWGCWLQTHIHSAGL